jgi:hypothetical protein
MIIKKKRIRNLGKYISPITLGSRIVLGVKIAGHNVPILQKAGFTKTLDAGESVLPAPVFGSKSDKPKEETCRMIEWTWKQWAPGGQLEERTDWRDRCIQRYPRTSIPAPSAELTIVTNAEGEKLVISTAIEYLPDKQQHLLHIINLFLEIFGECEVLQENLESVISLPKTLRRLNWEVLPLGEMPWERFAATVKTIVEKASPKNQRLIADRLRTINQHNPSFHAVGTAGFTGYFVFGFPDKNLFVLESIYSGNATYVLGKNWEKISQLTKAEILSQELHQERLIHRVGWHTSIQKLLA